MLRVSISEVKEKADEVILISDTKGLSKEEARLYKLMNGLTILDWSSHSDSLELWCDDLHILVRRDVVVWDGMALCLPSLAQKLRTLVDQLKLVNIRKVKPSLWVRG